MSNGRFRLSGRRFYANSPEFLGGSSHRPSIISQRSRPQSSEAAAEGVSDGVAERLGEIAKKCVVVGLTGSGQSGQW